MKTPIQQPVEGAHAPKADVPGTPSTSAVAGEDKGEPTDDEEHMTGEASLTPPDEDRNAAESADWDPPQP